MASVASQLIEEVTAHAQSDSLEDAREICADGTYFPNNLRLLLLLLIAFMQSIYNYIHITNNVSRVYNVVDILWLRFKVKVVLFPMTDVSFFHIIMIILPSLRLQLLSSASALLLL